MLTFNFCSVAVAQTLAIQELELFKSQAELGLYGDLQKTRSLCRKANAELRKKPNPFYQREFDLILAKYYLQKGLVDSALLIAFVNTKKLDEKAEGITPTQQLDMLLLQAKITLTRASNNDCEGYLRVARRRATELALPETQLEVERMLGFMHYYQNQMDSAIYYLEGAQKLAKKANNTLEELRLQLYLLSFKNGIPTDNGLDISSGLIPYSRDYHNLLDLDILSHYGFQKAIKEHSLHVEHLVPVLKGIVEKAKEDQNNTALFYAHIGLAHMQHRKLGSLEKALFHLAKARKQSPPLWNVKPLHRLIWCEVKLESKRTDSVASILRDKKWLQEGDTIQELHTYLMAKWHHLNKELDSAEMYYREVLKAPLAHQEHIKLQTYKGLSALLSAKGEDLKAQELLQQALVFQDSMNVLIIETLLNERSIMQLNHSRTVERQQTAIESRKSRITSQRRARRKTIIASLSILFVSVVLVFVIVLYNRSIRYKRDKERALHQLKLLKSQINPHFQFNALNSIAQQVKNGTENAFESVNHFAALSRKVLEQSREVQISLSEEIELLAEYLELERLRLKEYLQYDIKGPKGIDPHTVFIPPLMLQPIVENAVWHSPSEQKKIEITFSMEGATLSCKVTNPFVPSIAVNKDQHRSMGTHLIQERIELYNRSSNYQMRFEQSVIEHSTGKTYQCLLHIPIELNT